MMFIKEISNHLHRMLFLGAFVFVIQICSSSLPAFAQSVSWQEVDLGGASTPGSFTYAAGTPPTYTVVGSGGGFQGFGFDQFGFAQVGTTGNTELVAQLVSQSSALTGANSGLVMRDSLDVNAAEASIGVTVGSGIQFLSRPRGGSLTTTAGPVVTLPVYLRLTRTGNTITGSYSTDYQVWNDVGSFVTTTNPVMPNLYYTGFVTSSTTSSQNTAIFKYVSYNTALPQTASNLLCHLQCDRGIVATGGLVSQWTDQSGNGNHATGTGTTKPTLTTGAINSGVLPVVTFGGTQSLTLPSGFANLTGGCYVAAVLKPTSGSATCDALFLGNASNSDALYTQTIGKQASLSTSNGTTSSAVTTTSNPLSNTTYSLLEETLQPGVTAGTAVGTIWVNGVQQAQATNLQNLNNITRTQNFIGVGAGSTNFFQGGIAEILVYSSPPTAAQMGLLRSYMLSKYGIGTQPTLDAPVFSQGSGVFANAQQISITQDQGATTWFTVNGATPTTGGASQWYNSLPIQLYSGTETVQAIAVAPFFTNSPIASAVYQVDVNSQPLPRNGLVLWLNASDGVVLSGTAVASWQDSSGSGNTATQTTSANRPIIATNAINGLPAISFNGTSQYLKIPSGMANFTSGASIFAVLKPTGVTAGARILDFGNGATSDNLQLQEPATNSASLFVYNGTTPSSVTSSSAITLNQFQLLEAIDSGTGSATILTNGVPGGTSATMSALNNLTRVNNFIGQGSAGGNFFKGQIAELLVFNRAVTASEQASIEGWLLSKYQAAVLNTTPAPIFSIAAGALTAPSQVAIEGPPAAKIYWTRDGSTPSASSQSYNGPVTIAWSQTLKAISIINGVSSAVTSAAYTLNSTQYPAPGSTTTPLQINLQLPSVSIPQDANQH